MFFRNHLEPKETVAFWKEQWCEMIFNQFYWESYQIVENLLRNALLVRETVALSCIQLVFERSIDVEWYPKNISLEIQSGTLSNSGMEQDASGL